MVTHDYMRKTALREWKRKRTQTSAAMLRALAAKKPADSYEPSPHELMHCFRNDGGVWMDAGE